ncbi:hypothetical protein [Methanimicrococcus hongohii]|uniref:hypothetical protein n=1 Tax=Methanimicrococcus hongohii TaxID=3028295 RepID=UPI00292E22C5|nr:hypothetical protein [Methanimicrococcus sp. Hf6]
MLSDPAETASLRLSFTSAVTNPVFVAAAFGFLFPLRVRFLLPLLSSGLHCSCHCRQPQQLPAARDPHHFC